MSGLTWKFTDHARIVGWHLPSSQGDLRLMGPHWWPTERKQLWDLLQLLTSGSQQSPSLLLLSCFSSPQKWHFLCPPPPLVFSAWPGSQASSPTSSVHISEGIRWMLSPGTFSLLLCLRTAPDISTDAPACLGRLTFHLPFPSVSMSCGGTECPAPVECGPCR